MEEKATAKKPRLVAHVARNDIVFNAFPTEVILYVFSWWTAQDLIRASKVCHLWKEFASVKVLWQDLLHFQEFPFLKDSIQRPKEFYFVLQRCLKESSIDRIIPLDPYATNSRTFMAEINHLMALYNCSKECAAATLVFSGTIHRANNVLICIAHVLI